MSERRIVAWDDLSRSLSQLQRRQSTLLIAIDGPGGAGKSTIARAIAAHSADVAIVQMDDFFFPMADRASTKGVLETVGGDVDWERVRDQVIHPLVRNETARYQRYDWGTNGLEEWHEIVPGGVVIIEGVYSLRRELRDCYDFRIWVDCPKEVYLARGLARSMSELPDRPIEEARVDWETIWIPAEEKYAREHLPKDSAELIVDTSGQVDVPGDSYFVETVSDSCVA